ncbi:hypothetical protein Tco_0580129 [Tanacetum coccineum]
MVPRVPVSHASGMTLEEINKMQYLCGELTRAIYTTEEVTVIGRRAWYLGLSTVILVLALVLMVALITMSGRRNTCTVGLMSWIEGMESKLHISKCDGNSKVEYTACLLEGRALTWWNTQLQTRGREAAL